jgi:HSP20 family protein
MRIVRYSYPSYRSLATVPAAFARSPWSGLENEIDRLFAGLEMPTFAQRFPVDLYEDEKNAYVRAELPGVNRDEIQVEMTDGNLSISVVRKTPSTEGQVEQSSTANRTLSIPADIVADQVTANYENGVLTVTLPKREEVKPTKVTVAVK